jgi:hypothetical protein
MATPVAAGAAALVRQYLEEGFHTCGARSDEGGGMRNPSAALVKAMLISSARLPTSNFTRYHANTDHGTCQAHQVEGGGFPNTGAGRDSYCKLVHGDQAAAEGRGRGEHLLLHAGRRRLRAHAALLHVQPGERPRIPHPKGRGVFAEAEE